MNEKSGSTGKVRRSRAEIEKIVADYRQSGLTQVVFAKENRLNLGTFRSWLAKRRGDPAPDLCPVRFRQGAAETITIRMPGGIEVVVHDAADPQWVVALVKGVKE